MVLKSYGFIFFVADSITLLTINQALLYIYFYQVMRTNKSNIRFKIRKHTNGNMNLHLFSFYQFVFNCAINYSHVLKSSRTRTRSEQSSHTPGGSHQRL